MGAIKDLYMDIEERKQLARDLLEEMLDVGEPEAVIEKLEEDKEELENE